MDGTVVLVGGVASLLGRDLNVIFYSDLHVNCEDSMR
jgi:hypothetical protein